MKLLNLHPLIPAFGLLMATQFAWAQIPSPADAPKPMTPEQSAAAFKLPTGFRMEVIASEPLIASPSAVCWNERGRMFVSELHGYNLAGQLDIEELNQTGKLDTQVRRVQADEKFRRAAKAGTFGVVKLLRDTDGDGRMDAAEVWAANLPPVYGLAPARGGVIVACAPDIMFLADRDGDGKAETREVLFTGFPTGELERGINAPQWGVDGWIYFGRGWGGGKITGPHLREPVQLPGSDFRIRADGSAIEPVTGATHTFGFAMTESGDRFTVTTTIPGIFIAPLPWRYLARNPDAATPSLEAPTGDRRAYSISKPHPWRQKRADDPAYFKYYNSRYGAAESEADGWFTAACGPMIYQDRALPGLRGQYFVCEPAGNLIHRAQIETDGSTLKIRRAPGEKKSEFAASTDAWSHPMNLTHGPDGSIWVTDYYREIIEDYSAIPRHLQQQYGVYAGHDRGRIYRLTHRDAPRAPSADMSALDTTALGRECASPLFWRRQTAQRLLVERGEKNTAPGLRELLADKNAEAAAVIIALRTLDQLSALTARDVHPFISHTDPAIRIHALQLADRWFARDEGRALLDSTLLGAATEPDPRVQIQMALSLGEARDPRALTTLARFALSKLSVRWMDAALLSSLHGRGVEMLATLIGDPRGAAPLLPMLAQSIAARRDEPELASTLNLVATAKPDTQSAVLDALAKGRKNSPRKPLADKSARATLASLAASPNPDVRKTTRALEDTFVPALADDEALVPAGKSPPVESISDETFGKFVAALAGPRDLKHGHQLFLQACATCHRIGNEGHDIGPDLLGQLGIAEEALLKDILLPNERIRPGYETTLVQTADGSAITGILKDDGATSLALALPNGVQQVLLRKDVIGVRRLGTSLMPSFAEGLKPADVASLLAWLRSHLGTAAPKAAEARKANDIDSPEKADAKPAARPPLFRVTDLNVGESQALELSDGSQANIKLLHVEETRDTLRSALRLARVRVEVNGVIETIESGNYRLPVTVGGVQIDCPATQGLYLRHDLFEDSWGLDKDVRLRLWPKGSPWTEPGSFGYPIKQRWFGNVTQAGNEPSYVMGEDAPTSGTIYYHAGNDIGGAEGLDEVVAASDGLIISAGGKTLPEYPDLPFYQQSSYATVYVLDAHGWIFRYTHLKSVDPSLRLGERIKIGQAVGRLGREEGAGYYAHLHFDIKSRKPSGKWGVEDAYAFLWEAYLRQYKPPIVAVARPHLVTWVGEAVMLDGSRSWSAAGKIPKYEWTFGDGTTAIGSKVQRTYDKPGRFSEILRATDDHGHASCDFAIVDVVERGRTNKPSPAMHVTYYPSLNIRPGQAVTFVVRTAATTPTGETWDFGDGTPPVSVRSDASIGSRGEGYATTVHSFAKPGHYLVRAEHKTQAGALVTMRLFVPVE